MPKKSKSGKVDVSGFDSDERGRVVNKDIPEDARRGGVGKKAKKRKEDRASKLAKIAEEEEPKKKRKKRRREEDEDVPVKTKKGTLSTEEKRKRREERANKPASDKALAKMERRKAKMERDLDQLPATAGSGDEFDHQYRGMFDNLRTITALFEEKMLESPNSRDVYALSTLYSQMREVIADIRSAKDVTQQILELENRAYRAFMELVGQTYIDLYFKLQRDIRQYVKDTDAQGQLLTSLEGLIKDQGDKIQIGYSAMLDRVRTVLM